MFITITTVHSKINILATSLVRLLKRSFPCKIVLPLVVTIFSVTTYLARLAVIKFTLQPRLATEECWEWFDRLSVCPFVCYSLSFLFVEF